MVRAEAGRAWRQWLPVWLLLFALYQSPEGIGARWLHQDALAAGLMLAFLPAAWLAARQLGLGMGNAYALRWSGQRARQLAGTFGLALAVKATALALGLYCGIYRSGEPVAQPSGLALAGTVAWLAFYTFVPSLAEDILTRGFWAGVPGWPVGPAWVLGTTLLYTLNHVFRLGLGPWEWAMLLCFGLAYGTAVWRGGTLWAAVGLHWGWNFAGQVSGLLGDWPAVDADLARAWSGGAHLVMAAILMLAWRPATSVAATPKDGG